MNDMRVFGWFLALAAMVLLSQSVLASDFDVGDKGARPITVGAGILYRDKVYRDYDDGEKAQPFPLILYEGDRFFARGSNVGWKFIRGGEWELSALIEFQGDGYESSDSDFLNGMDDRDPYVGAGGQVTWQPSKWGFTLKGTTDITSESDGSQVTGKVHWTNKNGPFVLKLAGGAAWQSEDYVDYYFGVKSSEAIPGRPRYSPSDEINYNLAGLVFYQQPESPWLIASGLKYTFYGDDVDDSPITSDDQELAVFFGVGYTFRK
jgi:outer membrane protein